jgi:flagellum-specific ATP synthase
MRESMPALKRLSALVADATRDDTLIDVSGRITMVATSHCRVTGLSRLARLGDGVQIEAGARTLPGEIIELDAEAATVKPYGISCDGIGIGSRVHRGGPPVLKPHASWLGRTLDALGNPIDGRAPPDHGLEARALNSPPPPALNRQRVGERVATGVRVIDAFTPIASGQRIGIFAGSGVGKSSLLAMLARAEGFDAVVVALVGERGREVREFIEDGLGESMAKSVCVVATGDESALMRKAAPRTAMTIAEHLRDEGRSVLLIVDSITRYAHACREVALAAGEAPVARGFTPSVFAELPLLLERAGPGPAETTGAITGVFAVLVDGDDHSDPVADSIRGTLDGHVVLDRRIAEQGRYPAVDILASISRLASRLWTPEQRELVMRLRALVARFEDTRDLRLMGGYQTGSDAELDQAVAMVPALYEALKQDVAAPPSQDAFREIGEAIARRAAAVQSARKEATAST